MNEPIDSLNTIPHEIIRLAAERKYSVYPPSHIARIINRSIKESNYRAYPGSDLLRRGRGHLMENFGDIHSFPLSRIHIVQNGLALIYEGLSLPSAYGKEVLAALDEKFTDPKFVSYLSVYPYECAALASVAIASAHAFPDASGRTAVGLADYLLQKYAGRSLDLGALSQRNSDLVGSLVRSTIYMLPRTFHPERMFKVIKDHERTGQVVRLPTPETRFRSDVQKFLADFASSMAETIKNYDPSEESKKRGEFRRCINDLASLYKECSREK